MSSSARAAAGGRPRGGSGLAVLLVLPGAREHLVEKRHLRRLLGGRTEAPALDPVHVDRRRQPRRRLQGPGEQHGVVLAGQRERPAHQHLALGQVEHVDPIQREEVHPGEVGEGVAERGVSAPALALGEQAVGAPGDGHRHVLAEVHLGPAGALGTDPQARVERPERLALTLTPLELLSRLAALIPPPRVHRHRYAGVLAPHSPWRAAVTAWAEAGAETERVAPPSPPAQPLDASATPVHRSPARYLWAMLLARICEAFPLVCPVCRAEMRLIAFVTGSASITRILPGDRVLQGTFKGGYARQAERPRWSPSSSARPLRTFAGLYPGFSSSWVVT